MDTRKALKKNTVLKFYNASQGLCIYTIEKEISRGATCLVYDASYQNNSGKHKLVKIKECYPFSLSIQREADNTLIPAPTDSLYFKQCKTKMIDAFNLGNQLFSVSGLTNYTSNTVDIYELNNTLYIVSTYQEGQTLSYQQFTTLKDCISVVKSVSKVISKIHNEGYLYLDLKPENIFTLTGTTQIVQLFDFDSIIPISAFKNNALDDYKISYTKGYSALELQLGNINKISKKTDIYSIGAILYYLLFGTTPSAMDSTTDAYYPYQTSKYASKTYQDKIYDQLTDFFHHTLASFHLDRYGDMTQVIHKLESIEKLADTTIPYLLTTHTYCSAHVVGRDDETKQISQWLKQDDQRLLVITGMGGIGKTTLVQSYLSEHTHQFDILIYLTFHHSIKETIIDDHHFFINAVSQNEKESTDDYFYRKLSIVRQLIKQQKIILVIDNYEQFDHQSGLEDLLCLNWKIILVTRNIFSHLNCLTLNLRPIKHEALYTLFENHLKRTIDKQEVPLIDEIIDKVQGHTLIVELIAKQIAQSHLSIFNAVQLLRKNGFSNIASEKIPYTKNMILYHDTIKDIINQLFFMKEDNIFNQDLLRSIAYFGPTGIDIHFFSSIFGLPSKDSLNQLMSEGWLSIQNNQLLIHPVISETISTWTITQSFLQKSTFMLIQLKDKLTFESMTTLHLCEVFLDNCKNIPQIKNSAPYVELTLKVIHYLPRHREDCILKYAIALIENPIHINTENIIKLYEHISEIYEEKQEFDLAYDYLNKARSIVEKSKDNYLIGQYEYLWVGFYDSKLAGAYDAYTPDQKKIYLCMTKHLKRAIKHMKKAKHSNGAHLLAEYMRCQANFIIRSNPRKKWYTRHLLNKVKNIIYKEHQQFTFLDYAYHLTEAWYYTYVEENFKLVTHYIESAVEMQIAIEKNDLDLIDNIYIPCANILFECKQIDKAEELLLKAIELCEKNDEILPYIRKKVELLNYLLDVYEISNNTKLFDRTLRYIQEIDEKYNKMGLNLPYKP